MGWKTVKEYYGIKHIVQVRESKEYGEEPMILIGSPYISDIIVIRPSDGKILKRYKDNHINKLLNELQPRLDEAYREWPKEWTAKVDIRAFYEPVKEGAAQ